MQKAEYYEFKGGHTIPSEVVDRFLQVLLSCAQCCLSINWTLLGGIFRIFLDYSFFKPDYSV